MNVIFQENFINGLQQSGAIVEDYKPNPSHTGSIIRK